MLGGSQEGPTSGSRGLRKIEAVEALAGGRSPCLLGLWSLRSLEPPSTEPAPSQPRRLGSSGQHCWAPAPQDAPKGPSLLQARSRPTASGVPNHSQGRLSKAWPPPSTSTKTFWLPATGSSVKPRSRGED